MKLATFFMDPHHPMINVDTSVIRLALGSKHEESETCLRNEERRDLVRDLHGHNDVLYVFDGCFG